MSKLASVFIKILIPYFATLLHLVTFAIFKMKLKINWDTLGIGASLACATHCAVLPFVLTSLPLFGINIINNSGFEYFMIVLAFAIGSYALWHGYKKHHQRITPFFLLLLAKQDCHHYELFILPFAVIFIVSAHIINFRLWRVRNHDRRDIRNAAA